MGKAIEKIALERGHAISSKISSNQNYDEILSSNTDVAIEFTSPEAAFNNISYCLHHQIPVVSGSTGWLNQFDDAKLICEKLEGTFFYASNFSIGVNLFFKLNKILAQMMNNFPQFNIQMEEIHHTEKKDAPSGTGITLAEDIIANQKVKSKWVNYHSTQKNELEIISKRIDKVPGTHTIKYDSTVDSIEIKHTAHNREGFALGAVMAAEWVANKKGIFEMNDMIKL